MKRWKDYIRSAVYGIMHNKAYALFCICGTMLTFVFITILLQITHVIAGDTPPVMAADRVVYISQVLRSNQGDLIQGVNRKDVQTIMSNARGYECYTCSHFEAINVLVSDQLIDNGVFFVDENYWKVFQFDFVKGRAFTENEVKQPVAIINEDFAETYFRGDEVIGKEIRFQGNVYKVIGLVANVSWFTQGEAGSVWVPEHFNKNMPTGNDWVTTYILFPEDVAKEWIKKTIAGAINIFARMQNLDVYKTPDYVHTLRESSLNNYGGDFMLLGVGGIIFLLLIIPVLNIVLLSIANTNLQAREIGLKRALGADKVSAFLYILSENLILVIIGTLGGILLATPVCQLIDQLLLADGIKGNAVLLSGINWSVVFMGVLPLSLLFSLVSGGIPAYLLVKRPIVELLKGGSKC